MSYAIIKSRPIQILKNCQYIDLFLGDKKDKLEANYLAQLISVSKFIEEITYEKLYNTNKEEYDKKCEEWKDYMIAKVEKLFESKNSIYH